MEPVDADVVAELREAETLDDNRVGPGDDGALMYQGRRVKTDAEVGLALYVACTRFNSKPDDPERVAAMMFFVGAASARLRMREP